MGKCQSIKNEQSSHQHLLTSNYHSISNGSSSTTYWYSMQPSPPSPPSMWSMIWFLGFSLCLRAVPRVPQQRFILSETQAIEMIAFPEKSLHSFGLNIIILFRRNISTYTQNACRFSIICDILFVNNNIVHMIHPFFSFFFFFFCVAKTLYLSIIICIFWNCSK